MANEKRAATLERVGQAIELRTAGATWQTVADRLGYSSAPAAASSVRQYLRRLTDGKDLGEMLTMEELKLQQRERYIMAAAVKVPATDAAGRDTIDRARDRIAQRRYHLHGLGKVNVDHTVQVRQTPTAIIAEARERLLAVVDAEVIDPKEIEQ